MSTFNKLAVHFTVFLQSETSAAGGALGFPSSAGEPQPQLDPNMDQNHGGSDDSL